MRKLSKEMVMMMMLMMIMMVMVMMAYKFLLSAIYEENFQREEKIPQINVKTNPLIKEAGFD